MRAPIWFKGVLVLGATAVYALPVESSTASSNTAASTSGSEPMVPFDCNSYAYTALGGVISEVDLTTGKTVRTVGNPNGIGPDVYHAQSNSASPSPIKGLAYNPKDNLLYGFILGDDGPKGNSQLIQIDKNGKYKMIGNAHPDIFGPGDFDSQGNLWIASKMGDFWAKYDLVPNSPTWGKQVASGQIAPPPYGIFVNDWAYTPNSGEYMWAMGLTSSDLGERRTKLFGFSLHTQDWREMHDYGVTFPKDGSWSAAFTNGNEVIVNDIVSQNTWRYDPTDFKQPLKMMGRAEPLAFPNIKGARCMYAPKI